MRTRNGFTLISTLIAVILLGVGLTSLAGVTARVTASQSVAASRGTAVSIARAHLEQIRTRDASAVVNEAAQAVDAAGRPAADGPYTREVLVNDVRTNVRRVRVRVHLPRGEPVELSTMIFIGVT
jgi:type IV pilus assembly protein PilV